ncbi:putative porin [Cellulophaga baltica]|uniref:putative porin n=1 Tax=Cellulophaga baltica TaxID=76594 RepID=UPI002149125B|nr:putative porin [Cellulophaga baltica]MCR1025510.1 putative porin [Cellulophaga baltica]
MRYSILVFIILSSASIFSQQDSIPNSKELTSIPKTSKELGKKKDTVAGEEEYKPVVSDYKIVSFYRDTTFVDTTLSIKKEYQYNYLRKDDFELLPFANMGQPYNKLAYNFEPNFFYPKLGAIAKSHNYMEMEDIDYYNVPTPMTDVMFKTVFEEGQFLDILLTFNVSKKFNYAIAYKGFRSYGKYNNSQAEAGNFRTSANYLSENKRYSFRGHIAAQDLINEENGGLSDLEDQFISGDSDFSDRSRIDVNLTDAESKILGKRYFFENQYKLIKKDNDSSVVEKTSLALGHLFNYETKYYQFTQDSQNDFFGEAFVATDLSDQARLRAFYNQFSAEFYNTTLGRLKVNLNVYNYNYSFNSVLITDTETLRSQLKGDEISIGANYQKSIKGFNVKGDFAYNLTGDLTGSILNAEASYVLGDVLSLGAKLHSSSRMPNFNYLLYQSDYSNYNWDNSGTFDKIKTNSLEFNLDAKFLGSLSAKFTTLDNYTYFAVDPSVTVLETESENQFIKPFQETSSVNYIKVKYTKEFKLGNFALDNTVMYQTVSQSSDVLNVPQFTTRNSLYYSKEVFKKAMYLQTGVIFKYFSSYNMNAYNPLLGELYIQNNQSLGGFPLLDFFINAKVQQTRIYLKAEHFNSSFREKDYDYFSAPDNPYRDFIVRFGVVWNFFS